MAWALWGIITQLKRQRGKRTSISRPALVTGDLVSEENNGAGQMAWLLAVSTCCFVERAWVQFLAATSGSQLPITPVPEDRMPSSALFRHQSYIWFTAYTQVKHA